MWTRWLGGQMNKTCFQYRGNKQFGFKKSVFRTEFDPNDRKIMDNICFILKSGKGSNILNKLLLFHLFDFISTLLWAVNKLRFINIFNHVTILTNCYRILSVIFCVTTCTLTALPQKQQQAQSTIKYEVCNI